jgi:hypothetical protein
MMLPLAGYAMPTPAACCITKVPSHLGFNQPNWGAGQAATDIICPMYPSLASIVELPKHRPTTLAL